MKKELLILRTGDSYIRLRADGHELCDMEKASVFPLTKAHEVHNYQTKLAAQGIDDLRIHKLTISEEPFVEE